MSETYRQNQALSGAGVGKTLSINHNNFWRIFIGAITVTLVVAFDASAQTMVRATNGSCPSGTSHAGSGYCKSGDGSNFVRETSGSCPSGSSHAGANYCRSKPDIVFVPASNGSCPSGSSHAGAGYCKVR